MQNKNLIVLYATHWGRKFGGVNSFNRDFCAALARSVASSYKVICVVAQASPADVRDARAAGVTLVASPLITQASSKSDVLELLSALKRHGQPRIFVGHDVISGALARACKQAVHGSKLALIHHANHFDYQALKLRNGSHAIAKADEQRHLFLEGDELFAVGPMLRDSLARDLEIEVSYIHTLIPGLDGIEPAARAPPRLTAISFGRLDAANEPIKQGRLAAAGFAVACQRAEQNVALPEMFREHPTLVLIGIDKGSRDERELHAMMERHAGGARNLLALPFLEDRQQMLDQLRRASVALFLSWYDGFGLAAWEAIASGVPLILSRNCGAYQMVREMAGGQGLGCLSVVVINGSTRGAQVKTSERFARSDVDTVAQALLEYAARPEEKRQDALSLRHLLLEKGCTWRRCARKFAEVMEVPCRSGG